MKQLFIAIFAILLLSGCENMSPVSVVINNPTHRDYLININGEQFVKSKSKLKREYIPSKWTDKIVDVEVILPNHLIKYSFDCKFSTGRHYTISFDRQECEFEDHIYYPLEWYN